MLNLPVASLVISIDSVNDGKSTTELAEITVTVTFYIFIFISGAKSSIFFCWFCLHKYKFLPGILGQHLIECELLSLWSRCEDVEFFLKWVSYK